MITSGMADLLPVDEALERIVALSSRTASESLPLAEAAGRILSDPVIARTDQPPFDSSAMDGYAVRAADLENADTLRLTGVSQAGTRFEGAVLSGECVRIFTGAPMPQGADTVVMQEETERSDAVIRFETKPKTGANVRLQGNDFHLGQALLEPGSGLTPAALALAAAANVPEVSVAKRPRALLLGTGDELVPVGSPLSPDQIVASNSLGLVPLLTRFGATAEDLGIARDNRAELDAAIAAALAQEPELLITTGGASVGEHDLVQDALKENGVEIDFWRIAMRPGKPLMLGRKGRTLVFGLPGNPVSALVTARIFVVPAICAMLGAPAPASLTLPLARNLPPNGVRRHFMRARLVTEPGEATRVSPILETDSGHLSSLAAADCLVVQKENTFGSRIGELIETVLL